MQCTSYMQCNCIAESVKIANVCVGRFTPDVELFDGLKQTTEMVIELWYYPKSTRQASVRCTFSCRKKKPN